MDVQETIVRYYFNMEDAFRATIAYWRQGGTIEYPNAFLIAALTNPWRGIPWQDEWLNDPRLKNPCLKWWDDAAVFLGRYRDAMIADVTEDEYGNEYILFTNGRTMHLETARRLGWERVLQYCVDQGLAPPDARLRFAQDETIPF